MFYFKCLHSAKKTWVVKWLSVGRYVYLAISVMRFVIPVTEKIKKCQTHHHPLGKPMCNFRTLILHKVTSKRMVYEHFFLFLEQCHSKLVLEWMSWWLLFTVTAFWFMESLCILPEKYDQPLFLNLTPPLRSMGMNNSFSTRPPTCTLHIL